MHLKQQTLDGEILEHLPSPPPEKLDPPVCKYQVVFEPACSACLELEKVFIQDCDRDGMTARERAEIAARHQSPFDIVCVRDISKVEETVKNIEASDEDFVDAYLGH